MKHLGDICKINGAEVEPVSVIIGGSPCQDLSVAGKRAGLDGERSGLFMEQIRIIKEMRENDRRNGRTGELCRPRYMVWENVPGAFSSNSGEDFRTVLEETARVADQAAVIPRPPKDRWTNAGAVMGNGWSVAWRVSMHSFGESPSAAVESHLSQILEERPHPKYSLSPRACQGILNRAKRRGKELPEMLKEALIKQSATE